MSRSYKKHPCCVDHKGTIKKRMANKSIRRQLKNMNMELSVNNMLYKKMYQSYNICDYYWLYTWNQYWRNCTEPSHWLFRGYEPNYEKDRKYWITHYLTK